jgi:hypothetical protein
MFPSHPKPSAHPICPVHSHVSTDGSTRDMSDSGGQTALESALIGCFGGLFATFCVYPLDLVKSKVSARVAREDINGYPLKP